MKKADIGLVGLAVMGENLVMNMESKGFTVAVYNRTVEKVDAFNLGSLFYFFEFACGVSAYTLGVNPFNQPGVEAYKKNMFALLDKPGYEAESKAIQERLRIDN